MMRIWYRADATAAACLWLKEIPAPATTLEFLQHDFS
jgi:hypothetical protein